MKLVTLTMLPFLALMMFSCGDNKSDNPSESTQAPQSKSRYEEIMTIHDKAMARMSEIERHLRTFKHYKEDWPKGADSILLLKMPVFVEGLNEASDEMMTWMNNFKTEETWSDTGKYEQYLIKEKESIRWVEISIRTSIEQAEYFNRLVKGEERK